MLAAKKVDVIWTSGSEAAVAAARATTSIPIVFWGVGFPVEQGLIDSFAKPGRNATGVAWFASPEVSGKRLELLREIAPTAKRLALVSVPAIFHKVAGGPAEVTSSTGPAAEKLGYELREFPVEKAEDFEPAFAAILAWGAQALTVAGTSLTFRERQRIADFAIRNRLPSAFTLQEFVEAGGLVSYAIDWRPTVARSADYIDRILRGAEPGELPVDLPSRYETAVNLKTAKALGLTVPQSVLVRADRVIE
jgi:putative ABC transport system substrate-binding protein